MEFFENVRMRVDSAASYLSKYKQVRQDRKGLYSITTHSDSNTFADSLDSLTNRVSSSISVFVGEIKTEGQKKIDGVMDYFSPQQPRRSVRVKMYQKYSAVEVGDGRTGIRGNHTTSNKVENKCTSQVNAVRSPDGNIREDKKSLELHELDVVKWQRQVKCPRSFPKSESTKEVLKTEMEIHDGSESKHLKIKISDEENILGDKTRCSFDKTSTLPEKLQAEYMAEKPKRLKHSSQTVKKLSTDKNMKRDNETNKLSNNERQIDDDTNGAIKVGIQYLVISEMLKITIENVFNVPNEKKKSKNAFVTVELMSDNKSCVKQTIHVQGIDTFDFNKEIYFRKLELIRAHMSCLRFRVFMKTAKSTSTLKRYTCVGEALVHLDTLDIVGRVISCEKLMKSL